MSLFVEANGIKMHYIREGEGRPLVLLHGGTQTIRLWRNVIPVLVSSREVVAFDSRGHGATVNPTGVTSYAEMARDVASACEALGIRRADFWGLSDGANICLELGMQFPELCGALVAHAAIVRPSPVYERMIPRLLGTDSIDKPADVDAIERNDPKWAEILRADHSPQGPDHWKTLIRELEPLWKVVPEYSDAELGSITAAVLVVAGDRDRFIPVDEAVALYRRLSTAELLVLPALGHAIPSAPDTYTALVIEFIARHVHSAG